MKQRSNKTHCPICNKLWLDCEIDGKCDELYPVPKQSEKKRSDDDELFNPY